MILKKIIALECQHKRFKATLCRTLHESFRYPIRQLVVEGVSIRVEKLYNEGHHAVADCNYDYLVDLATLDS